MKGLSWVIEINISNTIKGHCLGGTNAAIVAASSEKNILILTILCQEAEGEAMN